MDRPLLSHLTANGKPAWPLSPEQAEAVQRYLGRGYREAPNPCPCQAADDVLVACRDCFGLPGRVVLCRGCGLMRTDPYLDPESIERFYRDDYRAIHTGKWSDPGDYFDLQKWRGRRILRWLGARQSAAGGRVAEIGCGAGGILAAFRDAGWQAVGCDYGDDFLQVGRKAGLDLRRGGAESLSQEAPFDLVVMSHVVEHFRDPAAVLRQVRSLLAPTGRAYLEVPGLFTIRGREKTVDRYLQYAHVWHFTLATLDQTLARAGFRRIDGDENVRSLYVPDEQAQAPVSHETFESVRRRLLHLNRLRRLPRLRSPAVSVIPVARALLGKGLYRRARSLYGKWGGEIA